ncbi:MAG: HAMP domain-containing sensor histidine kinase [Terracidiphilus sp.]
MFDTYHMPALVLTTLLLPAFGYLYLRFRDTRTLLWFLGFLFAIVRMLLVYQMPWWDLSDSTLHPWVAAVSQTSIQVCSAMFLASLSPQRFRLGRLQVLYVIPFTIPLVVYSILFHAVFHGVAPGEPLFMIFPALGFLSLIAGFSWALAKGSMPTWLSVSLCFVVGGAIWVYFTKTGGRWPLTVVECAEHFITALLLLFVFRRFSPGVVLSALGFTAWSMTVLKLVPAIALDPMIRLDLDRAMSMGKVVAAVGMIMLALEDELAVNKAAQERERRARQEFEAYASLILSRRKLEDFDRQANEICETVAENSRFAQVALLLNTAGKFKLAGSSGIDGATAVALNALAGRIPMAGFLAPGSARPTVEQSQTVDLDLGPWLKPGDDLKRLRFTSARAVPIVGRTATEGALLLAKMRNPREPLRTDDLLPVEMLTARLQAVRSQTMMLEKLIDSEKFAGLGQLANNVTHQLNNPLTVILGYASLLDESSSLSAQERKGVDAIVTEARRMRTTLESLSRISRAHSDLLTSVSVTELLADMEELHRSEFLRRAIDFRLSIAPGLPKVLCNAQHLRQAVLHCLQFAIEAADRNDPGSSGLQGGEPEIKTVRLEATAEAGVVQILVAHSGAGFLYPERAFDPFVPAQAMGEIAGLGLGLCASILREHNGRASAVNLEPRGAAILLELQAI